MTKETEQAYCCTRPKLATRLILAGYTPEIRPNLWNPKLKTWVFPISPELCRIVAAYLREIQKEPPRIIREGCREMTSE